MPLMVPAAYHDGVAVQILNTLGVLIALNQFDVVSGKRPPCFLNSVKLFLILGHRNRSPERDSNLGPSRIAVFEDCKAIALITQPPRMDG